MGLVVLLLGFEFWGVSCWGIGFELGGLAYFVGARAGLGFRVVCMGTLGVYPVEIVTLGGFGGLGWELWVLLGCC